MRIVINSCYGGFDLSDEAKRKLGISDNNISRNDPKLIAVVEELGKKANGFGSELKIIDIPDDVDWTIEEYDGEEWVSEIHRTWR